MKRFMISVAVAAMCTPSMAQTSEHYGTLAERGWSLLICSHLAQEENLRRSLSKRGLELGREFLEALMDGKVDNDQRYSWAAINFSIANADIDTIDFKLGTAWERAGFEASKLIKENGKIGGLTEYEKRKEERFKSSNCSIL